MEQQVFRKAAVALLVSGGLASCINVPPAPIDPTASAQHLRARSLADGAVTDALTRAGLAANDQVWTLDRLTVAAWTFRPEIALARAELVQGEAAERVAGEIPNPTFSFDPSYLYDNASGNLSPWTFAASLGFTIETAGKRGIRSDLARAESDSKRWQLAEAFWRGRQELRKAWTAWSFANRARDLAERELALRQTYATWVENAFKFGAAAQPDRLMASVALAQAQSALRATRADATAAAAALAAAVGVTTDRLPFDTIVDPVNEILPPPQADISAIREQALANRLSLRRALADYGASEETLRLEIAKQYPDINFGPGYIYDKGDRGVTLTLGFTLPLFHGNRAAIDQALAARAKAATQFESEQSQALTDIETAAQRYAAAYPALIEAKEAAAASAGAAVAVNKRLDAGGADRSEVVTAGLAQVVAERGALDAERAAVDALGALEDGIQMPVWPASVLSVARPDQKQAVNIR